MLFGYLVLFTALILSISSAVYSILGLTAIFAAAFWPIVILGGSLEFGKIVTTLWLHKYWDRAELRYKIYLSAAVAVLMMLTSMGVFGFLSKAHSDQGMVSGDVQAKIAIYDEKIRTAKDNIDANRRALKQMDEAVDQVMGRSTDEKGADKAVAIRRSQAKERARLLNEIAAEQKVIAQLSEERAPIAADVRKVEAEVGPIKYIAALIYGDNPDANLLESAVRWVIILIVVVFDPLALTLLLAATKTFEWERQQQAPPVETEKPAETEPEPESNIEPVKTDNWPPASELWPFPKADNEPKIYAGDPKDFEQPWPEEKQQELVEVMQEIFPPEQPQEEIADHDDEDGEPPEVYRAKKLWKEQNPRDTLKRQRLLYKQGLIDQLPWMALIPDAQEPELPRSGFGTAFPTTARKGDSFVRVDTMPTQLYKFNGQDWIKVDKNLTDSYTYDEAYIAHLIDKIATGELDPELLNDSEREQIAQHLENKATK